MPAQPPRTPTVEDLKKKAEELKQDYLQMLQLAVNHPDPALRMTPGEVAAAWTVSRVAQLTLAIEELHERIGFLAETMVAHGVGHENN